MTHAKDHRFTEMLTAILLVVLLSVTTFLFWPGLNSPFIFDDIPNLMTMGNHSELGVWNDIALFILQGDSGPTGRPISLASFYLDDNIWAGATASDFKYTNLMIHLLNGVLVFWLSLRLFSYTNLTSTFRRYAALLTTALWILHPIQLNTVLYVVQRMTELSTLFTLTGLLCYLYGREKLDRTPLKAWLLLIAGGGLSLLCSVLSKENGILLVVYILAIEYCLIRQYQIALPKNLNKGLYIAVWLPFLLISAFLVNIAWKQSGYAGRPFDLSERLLTETRVLWDYIGNILLPNLKGSSLFHDDYIISKGLLDPITTLAATCGIFALITLMFALRKRHAPVSFAIAWFMGGHLLESTTISLELYFEHRNYLPLFGIVFALTYYVLTLVQIFPKLRLIIPIAFSCYLIMVAFVTRQGVQQWTQPVQMIAGWLQDHPNSMRTLGALDQLIGDSISPESREKLRSGLLAISKQHKSSSYIIFSDLLLQCQNSTLTNQQLQSTLQPLAQAGYITGSARAYVDLISHWQKNACGEVSAESMAKFSDTLRSYKQLQHGKMPFLLHYWQAEIQATRGNLDATMQHHEIAYKINPSIDSLMIQASYLASAGLYNDAINKLKQAEKDLCTDIRSCLILKIRRPAVDQMMAILQKRLEQQKKAYNHAQAIHYSTR